MCGLHFKQKYEVIEPIFYEVLPVVQDGLEKLETRGLRGVCVYVCCVCVCVCVWTITVLHLKTKLEIHY